MYIYTSYLLSIINKHIVTIMLLFYRIKICFIINLGKLKKKKKIENTIIFNLPTLFLSNKNNSDFS